MKVEKLVNEEKGWSRNGMSKDLDILWLRDPNQLDTKKLKEVTDKRSKYYALFVTKDRGKIKYTIDTKAYESLNDVKRVYGKLAVGAVKSSFEFIPFK